MNKNKEQSFIEQLTIAHPDKKIHKISKIESLNEESRMNIPDSHYIIGIISPETMEVGKQLWATRFSNSVNPDGKYGLFHTSEIIKIDGDIIETKNSKYKIEDLN